MAITRRELALKYLWHWLGIQYSYGGDDAIEGWDCSGMVIEVLQSVGILPINLTKERRISISDTKIIWLKAIKYALAALYSGLNQAERDTL